MTSLSTGTIHERASSHLQIRAEMLVAALLALDRAGITWCVVSGCALCADQADEKSALQGAEDGLLRTALAQCCLDPDDVDLIVSASQFHDVPRILAALPGIAIVRALAYEATSTSYDLVSFVRDGKPVFLRLDVSSEVRAFETVVLWPQEVLEGRRRLGELLWVPKPSVQFIFSLLKQLHKAQRVTSPVLKNGHVSRLSRLYGVDPEGCRQQLRRFFSEAAAARIAWFAEHAEWDWLFDLRRPLRADLIRTRTRTYPLGSLRYRVGEWSRWIRRVRQPTGFVAVFLGIDGSGKSTVMSRVLQDLRGVFPPGRCYDQRPCVLWAGAEDRSVRGPRAMPRRSRLGSLVKLVLWGADYWAGFLFAISPRLVQSTPVFFERYYYDLLVDPDRYRYGGPPGAANLLARVLPRPELVILLDAPPELSDGRRRDGQFRSTPRLRGAYTALARSLPRAYIIDASRPIDDVVAEVARVILRFLGQRTVRRLGGRA